MPAAVEVTRYKCCECDAEFGKEGDAATCERGHVRDRKVAELIVQRDAALAQAVPIIKELQATCAHPNERETGRQSRVNESDDHPTYVAHHCPLCDKRWEVNIG